MSVNINLSNDNIEYFSTKRLYLSRAKLKQSSQVSALLSGFALVAMVELDIDTKGEHIVPFPLLLAFTLVTTLLVSVHMLALMISTCILPHIDAVASCRSEGEKSIQIDESPHDKMSHYTAIAWAFSTVLGIFLFLIELAILVWVKFWGVYNYWVAIASTIMLIPVICAFIFFACHFYHQLVAHKFERSAKVLHELEAIAEQIHDPYNFDDIKRQYK